MIAKNGDRVQVVENGEDGALSYTVGQQGEMVDKAWEDDCGGYVLLDSGDQVYLYADEYEVIEVKTYKETPITAESLRDAYESLEDSLVSLQQQVAQIVAEKTKVSEQLKEMGFALIPLTPKQKIAVPVQDIEDYSNPCTWKVGYGVKCVNDDGWRGHFVSGGNYKITYVDSQNIIVKGEREDVNIRWDCRDFEFYAPF